jgi:hypothetical protein
MFGLTKREQRWKAEQQAAEVLAGLAAVAIRGVTDARIAEAQTDAAELSRLRGLYEELLYAVGNKYPGETRHQTALRYIQQAEAPRISAAQCEGPNVAINLPP